MLYYKLYSNVSDEGFLALRNKLTALENVILNHSAFDGWTLTMEECYTR